MPEQPGDDLPLTTYGSWATRAWRSGATVVRQAGPWTPAVLALLKHFEQVGFAGAPKVVSTGLDADGREVVTYLPGSSPHPRAWTDDAVHELGRVLRAAHDAARSFQPPASARWRAWFGRDLPGDDPVIGHCDPGPWNWVAVDDTRPYALIDWEFAGPVDALREVAHAAWLNAQLHDDDIAKQHVLPEAGARARQARLLLDGYRLSAAQRIGMLDRMIELAIHSARAEAVQHTVSAASPDGHDNDNYPGALGCHLAYPQRVLDATQPHPAHPRHRTALGSPPPVRPAAATLTITAPASVRSRQTGVRWLGPRSPSSLNGARVLGPVAVV